MSIFVGSSEINDIYIGSNIVDNIFVGSNKVWSRPLLYDILVGDEIINYATYMYGYDHSQAAVYTNVGSATLVNTYPWFNSQTVSTIGWKGQGLYTQTWGMVLRIEGQVANSDASFTTMDVNGNVFNRTDATYLYYNNTVNNVSYNYTEWQWPTITATFPTGAPWSGEGNTDRVRFERDV
jgi:hypothetical protein